MLPRLAVKILKAVWGLKAGVCETLDRQAKSGHLAVERSPTWEMSDKTTTLAHAGRKQAGGRCHAMREYNCRQRLYAVLDSIDE